MLTYDTFYQRPFSEIIDLACSRSHVPGGGSVSAMSAVLGASMSMMVANLTLNKSGYETMESEVKDIMEKLEEGIAELKILTKRDMEAFDNVLKAYRLPKESEKERDIRLKEIQNATIEAAMAPLMISSKVSELLFCNRRLAEIGNGSVVSDSEVASIILESSLRAALVSVDINLDNIRDPKLRDMFIMRKERLLKDSHRVMKETLMIAKGRDKSL
jgi:formiminotetrahydrofolate cyclodeaminase